VKILFFAIAHYLKTYILQKIGIQDKKYCVKKCPFKQFQCHVKKAKTRHVDVNVYNATLKRRRQEFFD
jgi:hypothetical protein